MLTLEPIGLIATPFHDRYRAPRQPSAGGDAGAEGVITLAADRNFDQALEDLDGFEMIWLLYWFDRNTTWKPKVLPPRGSGAKRGLFATRSPHRPNPIGLSLVRLLEVRGRTVRVGGVDLLDGTPILDIKPYLPYAEAFPDAKAGWLDELSDAPALVRWSILATEQATWLADRDVAVAALADERLAHTSSPHPYRRIRERADGTMELAIKSWRVVFARDGDEVAVLAIESGYAAADALSDGAADRLHDGAVHAEFHRRWPNL